MDTYNLLPALYETEQNLSEESFDEQNAVIFKNGIVFDYKKGDFVRNANNKLLDSDGIESWKAWCTNCIQTERYKHLAYGPYFGIETAPAFEAETRDEAESILALEITEALLSDPYQRTSYIADIEFDWSASDALKVSVVIQGVEDVTIDITAYITKGEV